MKNNFFLILFICFTILGCTKSDDDNNNNNETEMIDKTKILELVNKSRSSGCNCGSAYFPPVTELTWNDKLETAAQKHSDWMSENNKLSHTGENNSSAGDRITAEEYTWNAYGENIAEGYTTEEAVVQGWLDSEGHCKNIMSGNFSEMGVALTGTYWTQVFANSF